MTATVLDRYFELSDLAGTDQAAFDELIGLFAADATIKPNGVAAVTGTTGVAAFFRGFLVRNAELKHVWTVTDERDRRLTASWAVAGRRSTGEVFALAGRDIAHLDSDGRIAHLEVTAS